MRRTRNSAVSPLRASPAFSKAGSILHAGPISPIPSTASPSNRTSFQDGRWRRTALKPLRVSVSRTIAFEATIAAMSNVSETMRADWNQRACEDAHYYVAFGSRQQDLEGFESTGD